MQLITLDNKPMFINDEVTYKNYLENKINQLDLLSQTRALSIKENNELQEAMFLHNQIVDYQNSQENDTPSMGK